MRILLFSLLFLVIIISSGCTTFSSQCGFEQCHGLDLTCGPNIPDACTELYHMGDSCRQFAACEVNPDNSCVLVKDPKFDSCKSCVEKCLENYKEFGEKAFRCEAYCMKTDFENELFCESDLDCACGVHEVSDRCFYGNKNYVNTKRQCPDFCTGIDGSLEIKCINSQCRQI